jgi:hypothetical protein
MNRKNAPESPLAREDRRLIEAIADAWVPDAVDPRRQAAFRRRLEERLDGRERSPGRVALAAAGAVVTGAMLWALMSPPAGRDTRSAGGTATLDDALIYAFVDPDAYDGRDRPEFLPDDYLLLASVLDVRLADF